MSTTFHPLKIKKIKRETPDCVSVSFDVPEDLKEQFRFTQGQYLTFKQINNGQEIRRSYSICASPCEDELKVAVKKITDGVFSSYINDVAKEGDVVEVMTPQGTFFTELKPYNKKTYVAFAAGSGITPVMSIVKSVLKNEPNSNFVLIYGNRNKAHIIFKEDIEALKNIFMDRLSVYHILSREIADADLLAGRITAEKAKLFLEHIVPVDTIDEVFLCGPEDMILDVRDTLQDAGLEPKKIHFELFYSATAEEKKKEHAQAVNRADDKYSKVTVKLDASALNMDLAYHGQTILDAALQNGADLPYACKGGVCATCKCKLEKGEVEMDINYSLEQDELDAGFILSCQAHPRSEEVIVNFDIK
ncbi:1,2-phenylacetyl-CoA epoxidase subunit PaaE [Soonwooa sp.]|uniref:1,2-phenylacetyl-CoA epoxidase subunit PaaE n=1 Tax=Soonwooa sp. TaxID=1938592 RepID=UPI0028AAB30A|nr:1,2-phenylacetyl-CoA epoxidase subunit PaaE [Soonwooa sp.]